MHELGGKVLVDEEESHPSLAMTAGMAMNDALTAFVTFARNGLG
jgi:hypothetical protein